MNTFINFYFLFIKRQREPETQKWKRTAPFLAHLLCLVKSRSSEFSSDLPYSWQIHRDMRHHPQFSLYTPGCWMEDEPGLRQLEIGWSHTSSIFSTLSNAHPMTLFAIFKLMFDQVQFFSFALSFPGLTAALFHFSILWVASTYTNFIVSVRFVFGCLKDIFALTKDRSTLQPNVFNKRMQLRLILYPSQHHCSQTIYTTIINPEHRFEMGITFKQLFKKKIMSIFHPQFGK